MNGETVARYSGPFTLDGSNTVTDITVALPGGAVLGLMPDAAIVRLLGAALPDPAAARGTPRAELYLVVPEAAAHHARALAAGARELSPMGPRSWGHVAAYSLDPDGHVLAFATAGTASVATP